MKKTTAYVAVKGWGRGSAPGWRTDTPGLVAVQVELEVENKKKCWLLLHEESGLHVRTFAKRSDCNAFAVHLGTYADWTLSADELQHHKPAMALWLREYALLNPTMEATTQTEEST